MAAACVLLQSRGGCRLAPCRRIRIQGSTRVRLHSRCAPTRVRLNRGGRALALCCLPLRLQPGGLGLRCGLALPLGLHTRGMAASMRLYGDGGRLLACSERHCEPAARQGATEARLQQEYRPLPRTPLRTQLVHPSPPEERTPVALDLDDLEDLEALGAGIGLRRHIIHRVELTDARADVAQFRLYFCALGEHQRGARGVGRGRLDEQAGVPLPRLSEDQLRATPEPADRARVACIEADELAPRQRRTEGAAVLIAVEDFGGDTLVRVRAVVVADAAAHARAPPPQQRKDKRTLHQPTHLVGTARAAQCGARHNLAPAQISLDLDLARTVRADERGAPEDGGSGRRLAAHLAQRNLLPIIEHGDMPPRIT